MWRDEVLGLTERELTLRGRMSLTNGNAVVQAMCRPGVRVRLVNERFGGRLKVDFETAGVTVVPGC